MPHGDAVRNRNGSKFQRVAARRVYALFCGLRKAIQREVARGNFVPRRADADLGFDPVVISHSYGTEHAPRCSLFESVRDVSTSRLDIWAWRRRSHVPDSKA